MQADDATLAVQLLQLRSTNSEIDGRPELQSAFGEIGVGTRLLRHGPGQLPAVVETQRRGYCSRETNLIRAD